MKAWIELIAAGGCYWRRKDGSPGHSLVLSSGTRFRIPLEGPKSHIWCAGTCKDGHFVLDDGQSFASANEAVNSVREPSTNAFLYVEFETVKGWELADDLRLRDAIDPGPGFDELMAFAKDIVRKVARQQKRTLDDARVTRTAAQHVVKNWESFAGLAESYASTARSVHW